jgi:uncharacterized membrane protein YfcA
VTPDVSLWADFAVASAAIFAGSVLQGAVGYGLALVAAPILYLVDERLVPAPLLLTALLLTVSSAYRDRHAIDFKGLVWGTVGRIPGTVVGAAILAVLPPDRLAAPLGLIVLLAVAMSASGMRLRPGPATLLFAGLLSGIMGTTSSIGGPPIAMVYQHSPGDQLRGTLGGFFVLGCLLSLIGVASVGRLGVYELGWGAALLPAVGLGFTVSSRLTPWIDRGYTRPAVLAVAAVGGVGVLIRQLW